MSSTGAKILIRLGLIVAGLVIGLALGYGYGTMRTTTATSSDGHETDGHATHGSHAGHDHPHSGGSQHDESHAHGPDSHGPDSHGDHSADDHEDSVLVLSAEAAENLQLVTGPAEISDHFRELLIPGRVVETPGKSDVSVTAPTGGVVSVNLNREPVPDTHPRRHDMCRLLLDNIIHKQIILTNSLI